MVNETEVLKIPTKDPGPSKHRTNMKYRDEDILRFIRAYSKAHRYSPSVRDIRDGVGMSSTSVVSNRLNDLVRRGLLVRPEGIARAMHVPRSREVARLLAN